MTTYDRDGYLVGIGFEDGDLAVIVEDCEECEGRHCRYCNGRGVVETQVVLRTLEDMEEEKDMAADETRDEDELGREFELEPDEWATIVDAIVALDIKASTEITAKLRKEFEGLRDHGPALIAL